MHFPKDETICVERREKKAYGEAELETICKNAGPKQIQKGQNDVLNGDEKDTN